MFRPPQFGVGENDWCRCSRTTALQDGKPGNSRGDDTAKCSAICQPVCRGQPHISDFSVCDQRLEEGLDLPAPCEALTPARRIFMAFGCQIRDQRPAGRIATRWRIGFRHGRFARSDGDISAAAMAERAVIAADRTASVAQGCLRPRPER